jgi:hypothetical protein
LFLGWSATAERRYARRERSLRDGVVVTDRDWAMLQELLV